MGCTIKIYEKIYRHISTAILSGEFEDFALVKIRLDFTLSEI